jgi:hypothetical protein
MENLRKKNETQTQNKESQNSKIKWKLKEKLKNCQSNNTRPMKGICKNSLTVKRPNLRITGIEEV